MSEWFFGNAGISKLTELNRVFRSKTLNLANTKLNSNFDNYSPWMSNTKNLKALSHLFVHPNLLILDKKISSELENHYLTEDDSKGLSLGGLSHEIESLYRVSLGMILESNSDLVELFPEVISHIIPINTNDKTFQNIGIGFSSHLAKGAIFLSPPQLGIENTLQLAINMIHELGHQCLYIYQTADPIIKKGIGNPIFSYVRQQNRPAIQSFHATVAIAFMVKFLIELKNKPVTTLNYYNSSLNKLRKALQESLKRFEEINFTELGGLLYKDLVNYEKSI